MSTVGTGILLVPEQLLGSFTESGNPKESPDMWGCAMGGKGEGTGQFEVLFQVSALCSENGPVCWRLLAVHPPSPPSVREHVDAR